MERIGKLFLRRFLKNQRGQSAVVVAVTMFAITALAASGIESGHVYYAYRMLLASTRAATLAAAQDMPDLGTQGSTTQGTAWGDLVRYSSETGYMNASNLLQNDSIGASFYCSSTATGLNVSCEVPPTGEGSCGSGCNAVTVTQTAKVPLWFGGVIGIRTFNLSASATAAMQGGTSIPYNIAVIIDTTESMTANAPSGDGCGSGQSQIACAVLGLKTMLQKMYPCPQNETCPGNKAYADGVALFVFPAIGAGSQKDDTTCPTKNPPIVPYTFINVTPGATQNLNNPTTGTDAGTYEVVPFDNGYKQTDGSTTLDSGDALAAAVGVGSGTCKGLQAPGGEGTYYAQVIYQAQAALLAQQASYPNSKNVLIIMSDGDATSCAANGNTAAGACNSSGQIVALSGTLNGTGTATTNPSGYQLATYPSAVGMCGQAVQAAQLATAAGTEVFTVAMGAETSGSCASDKTHTITSGATYGAEGYPSGAHAGQACNAIGAMASNVNTFFSDNTAGCPATGLNAGVTTMTGIFDKIGESFTAARIIPTNSN